ncbi:MAG: conjugal transfer protein TraF [Sulfurimonas sp.]
MTKVIVILILCSSMAFANFYKNNLEGWFAYKDINLTEKLEDNNTKKDAAKFPAGKKPKKIVEIPEDLEELSAKEFEALITEAKEISTMNPTKDNVRKFIILQNFVQQKADALTSTWGEVMLENPELDISVNIAKTSFAKSAMGEASKTEKKAFFSKFSKHMTVVMFYDSNKREVASKQDDVMNFISYDYSEIKQLKIDINNKKANELFAKLKISDERLPDIWLMIDFDGKQAWKRVAIGLSTQDKIMNKIYEYSKEIFQKEKKK